MHISPVNFCGRTARLQEQGIGYKEMNAELKAAYLARLEGVSAPNYQGEVRKAGDSLSIKYQLDGEPASVKTNPITPKHIESLLQNFLLMDKAGFYHKNLSTPNVLFAEDGKIEFASMRSMVRFETKDKTFSHTSLNMPNYIMPSNAERYEATSLCRYVHGLNEYMRDAFVREYLSQKSDYHKLRAYLLETKGFDSTDKAVIYEKAQGKIFEDPGDVLVDYIQDKFEISRSRDNATIMWHKAGGYFDGKTNPSERFASVIMMLECLKSAIALRDKAEFLSENAPTPEEREYFAVEKDILNLWTKNIYDETKTGGENNFCNKTFANNKGLYLGCAEDRALFDEFYGDIDINDSLSEARENIDTVIRYYTNLIEDWSPENNELYKMQYLKQAIGV